MSDHGAPANPAPETDTAARLGAAADSLPDEVASLVPVPVGEVSPTPGRLRLLFRRPGTVVALAWVLTLAVLAVFAPLIGLQSTTSQDLTHTFAGPSGAHWLGTDDLGRDVLSRLIYGSQISLRVSLEVVGTALALGLVVGLFSGMRGGWIDNVLMRIMDGGLSFPPLVLALAVVAVLGPSANNIALALAVVFTPGFARLIRGQTLAVKEETFVEASRSLGSSGVFIAVRRIFPNVLGPVVVQASLSLGYALLAEAGLSFLGLGAQPPTPSWGSMLYEAYTTGLFDHPWGLVPPGAAIALAVLAFTTTGDGLTAVLGVTGAEPKVRTRRRLLGRPGGVPVRAVQRGLTAVQRAATTSAAAAAAAGAADCLAVEGLTIEVATPDGYARVVDDVSFTVRDGETLGLVGESGSGKTVTSLSVMRLLPSPAFRIVGGVVRLGGRDLLGLDLKQLRAVRGRDVAMVFQDPVTSLNPARTIGSQLVEAVRLHQRVPRSGAGDRAVELLGKVGIPDPASRLRSYPHQLSGGMRQRVVIAMALACHPRLLIADEPTTALDVTVQGQILDLFRELSRSEGLAVLFITHDLGVVGELCDRVAVMYSGQIVETGPTADVFGHPRHPYTAALVAASTASGDEPPEFLHGQAPPIGSEISGCRFADRCRHAAAPCYDGPPELRLVGTGADGDAGLRRTRCRRTSEIHLQGVG